MTPTRETLLARLRDFGDDEAWHEFYRLYAPVLYRFARASGLAAADAEEVRDQCLGEVARSFPGFRYDRARGRFGSWLCSIARARVVDLLRTRRGSRLGTEEMLSLPDRGDDPERAWEEEWRAGLLRFALDRARLRVSERRWQAFERTLRGQPVADVCRELGMNANQVYKARSQVLQEVRSVIRRCGDHD